MPQAFARKQWLSMPGVFQGSRVITGPANPFPGPTAADLAAAMRIGSESDAYRTCPECGSRDYSQRLVWF